MPQVSNFSWISMCMLSFIIFSLVLFKIFFSFLSNYKLCLLFLNKFNFSFIV